MFKVGDRVRNKDRYVIFKMKEDSDVLHIGATGVISDDDPEIPSVKWDHLPDSPDWAQDADKLELIEEK